MDISPILGPKVTLGTDSLCLEPVFFMAVGTHSGLHSGLGYKIAQDNGALCAGDYPCENDDVYNYFWFFDVTEMLESQNPWDVRPISYGKLSHPYDMSGVKTVLGSTYDKNNKTLYLSKINKAHTIEYDRPPTIIAYKIEAKN